MKRFTLLACLLVFVSSTLATGQGNTQDAISPETVGRVVKFLEDSGYSYTKRGPSAWTITFKGQQKPNVLVFVGANNDRLIIGSVVAQQSEVSDEREAMRQLLRMNFTVRGATLLIDDDGDYVAHASWAVKDLNSQAFKESLEAVANAADAAYGAIKNYLARDEARAPSKGAAPSSEIRTTSKPPNATESVQILNGRAILSFDPTKWKQTASQDASILSFSHRKGDGYARVIFERIAIPLEQLRDIALSNARENSKDMKIVAQERRRVNGTEVLMMQMDGTTSGVAFAFLGYYWTGSAGTIQIVTYTAQSLLAEFRSDFEDFLNGFQVVPPGDAGAQPGNGLFHSRADHLRRNTNTSTTTTTSAPRNQGAFPWPM